MTLDNEAFCRSKMCAKSDHESMIKDSNVHL